MALFIKNYRLLLAALFFSAGVLTLYFGGAFRSWEWRLNDAFYVGIPVPSDIVIVAIDDPSIQTLGRWPWDRRVHADLIDKISAAGPRTIGYDVNFPEPSNEASDASLETALAASGKVVLPEEARLKAGLPPVAETVLAPLPRFAKNATLGFSNTPPDQDGVLRRLPVAVKNGVATEKPFYRAILEQAGERPQVRGDELLLEFAGPPGSFKTFSAKDVLAGLVGAAEFRGRIVLVGATAPDLHDESLTPTAKRDLMSGIEIHANAVMSARSGGLAEEPPVAVAFSIFLFACLGIFASFKLTRGLYSVLITIGLAALYLVVAFIAFEARVILSVFYPLLALVLTWAFGTLLRLSREKKEKGKLRAALGRYLSRQVVEYFVAHPEKLALGGEKREMTVLFSDLRGFTSFSEKLKPEELVSVLNDYLSAMTSIVFEYDGVLDKYMGDAVMAFWNAPMDDADHAEHAARAALAMRDRLRVMNQSGAFPTGIELRLGIGLNSGEMVVGNIGGEERFDYTVMGDAVNLGSRLEGLNKEYGTEIIASEFAARRLSEGFLLRPLDLVAVKGKKEPVEIFEVVALRDGATPELIQFVSDFIATRELYQKMNFAAAAAAFEKLAEKFPDDQPTKVYLSRAAAFRDTPPPADWNGVWVMRTK